MSDPEAPTWGDLAPLDNRPAGVSTAEFRRRFIAKEPVQGLGFMKRLATKSIEKGADRTFRAVAGASTVDLERDTVSVKGTDLSFYKTNPVLLPNHDRTALPIGVTVAINKRGDELRFTPKFAPPEVSPLAEAFFQNHLWRMSEKALGDSGAMFSVFGFPKGPGAFTFNRERGGIDFEKQVLWEISDVTIGAQPRARILAAKAAGVPMEPVLEWALDLVKSDDTILVLERSEAEKVVKTLDPLKGLEVFELHAAAEPEEDAAEPASAAIEKQLAELGAAVKGLRDDLEKRLTPEKEEPAPAEKSNGAETVDFDQLADKVLKAVDSGLIRAAGVGI